MSEARVQPATRVKPRGVKTPPAATPGAGIEIDSRELFQTHNALHIRHDGERYTLRRTSKGKLILTK